MRLMIPIAKPSLDHDEAQAAYDTILTGWITQGPKVQEFEEKFAAYTGASHAVAVSNCTTALHLSMIVAGIGPGDEVICPSMSYIATANCIRYVGATPIFAEVDPDTYNLDVREAEKSITERTKAILLVHQMGMPADIDAFRELCDRRGLQLIEDAACAIGSSYKGVRIGAHSDLVCFSFHPRKVITTGDGGMVTTTRRDWYERLRLLRQHGMSINDRARHESSQILFEDHLEVGYNYRMTDIQAAVGIRQLEKLDTILDRRRELAATYFSQLRDIEWIRLPYEADGCISNYQSFSIRLLDEAPISRNGLMQRFLDAGISTRRGIMTAHRETAYKSAGVYSLPISEQAADSSILVPLFQTMTNDEIHKVIQVFKGI